MGLPEHAQDVRPAFATPESMAEHIELLERAIEEQAEDANRRTMLLAHLSHELRTPMSAILGMIDLLLDTDPNDMQREMLEVSKQASDELLTLINDILDLSKLDADGMRLEEVPFDITDAVGQVLSILRPLATDKDISLASDIKIGVPDRVIGDPGRLRQILINLVGNAIKFTDQGSVVVGVGIVSTSPDRATIRIDVVDTGAGIPADRLEAIFDPYEQAADSTTRTHGGTGLGLAICRQLADLMGGRLTVTSAVGRGSTFTIVVGFATRADTDVEMSDVSAATQAVAMPDTAGPGSIADLIAAMGLAVIETPVVDDDVIIVDLDHIGFIEIESIRARYPDNPLIIVTTTGQRGDAARSTELGISGYLTRPVTADEMALAVDAARSGVGQLITRHWLREQQPRRAVLVVEDDEVNRRVTVHMLEQLDYSVIAVASATEALDALSVRTFDLIVSDLGLPDMDGTDFIRQVKAQSDTPALAATGRVDQLSIDECRDAGFVAVLAKPFTIDELADSIRPLLQ